MEDKLVVRDVFTAKPGKATKLARLFKKMAKQYPNTKVMTDVVGNHNTVVMEMEVSSFSEYERVLDDHTAGKIKEKMNMDTQRVMATYTQMFIHGRREIFKIIE